MWFYCLFSFLLVSELVSAFPEKDLFSGNSPVLEDADGRIAGGEEADTNTFPFQVQIVRDNAPFCSGAIYNESFILTAAHCVEGAEPQELQVRAGSLDRGKGMMIPIDDIMMPPEYDYPQNNLDIALLRTQSPIRFSRTILSGFIADVAADNVPNELRVSGFGLQGDDDNELSDELMFVDLPIISRMECQMYYPGTTITTNMICAYSTRDMSKGTCKGDGGDPASVGRSRRLLGISSFARGCGTGMGPSVFTFLQAREVREFIQNGAQIPEELTKQNSDRDEATAPTKPDTERIEKLEKPSKQKQEIENPEKPFEAESENPEKFSKDKSEKENSENPSKENLKTKNPENLSKQNSEIEKSEKPSKEEPEKLSKEKPDKFSKEEPSVKRPEEPLIEDPEVLIPEQPEEPERFSEEIPEQPSK